MADNTDDFGSIHLPRRHANSILNALVALRRAALGAPPDHKLSIERRLEVSGELAKGMLIWLRQIRDQGAHELASPEGECAMADEDPFAIDFARQERFLLKVESAANIRGHAHLDGWQIMRGILSGVDDAGIIDELAQCPDEADVATLIRDRLKAGQQK